MYNRDDPHGTGHVSVSEARQDFADLVNRAAYGGERVRVVRRGQQIAAIVPIEDVELLERLEDGLDVDAARTKGKATRGAAAVRRLRAARDRVVMSTDEIMALTRGD